MDPNLPTFSGSLKCESESNSDYTQREDDYFTTPRGTRRKRYNRPRVTDPWSAEQIVKLTDAVKRRPCIWDLSTTENRLRKNRVAAWKEIHAEFEGRTSHRELTAKWQNLRIQYRASMDSIRKGKTGTSTNPPLWKYHRDMAFLGAGDNMQNTSYDSSSYFDTDGEEPMASCSNSAPSGGTEAEEGFVANVEWDPDMYLNLVDSNDKELNEMQSSSEVGRIPEPFQRPNQSPVDDAIDIFGKYLASYLRKIRTDQHREKTQRQLIQLMWECIDSEPVRGIGAILLIAQCGFVGLFRHLMLNAFFCRLEIRHFLMFLGFSEGRSRTDDKLRTIADLQVTKLKQKRTYRCQTPSDSGSTGDKSQIIADIQVTNLGQ